MTKTVNELTNQELDYWVARSCNFKIREYVSGPNEEIEGIEHEVYYPDIDCWIWYEPTTYWGQCGPLIEQFKLVVSVKSCYSTVLGETFLADTAQQAICKAVITQEIGHIINEEMK